MVNNMNGDRITGIINEPYNPEKEPVVKSGARQLPNTGIESYSYFKPVRSSCRFRFAAHQHHFIRLLFELMEDKGKPIAAKTKEEICRTLLKMWQEDETPYRTGRSREYIEKLFEKYDANSI